jgi:uncharacterized phiE125 gp8 family phage protein
MNLLIRHQVTTDLTVEPVTLNEAKAAMKVAFTDDDTYITNLITASRLWLENYTGLAFGAKTQVVTVDLVCDEEWKIYGGPVSSITSVTYKSYIGDTEETLTAGEHYVLTGDMFWPLYTGRYVITFVGGYTTLPSDLEEDIKKLTAWQYQNRGINLSNEATSLVDFPKLNAEFYKRVVI